MVTDEALIEAARAVRLNAYAPYSHFKVGAAVLTDTGRVYVGCNVENASFPLTVCAERTAIGSAVAAGETRIVKVAVITDTEPPASPCGACRQVIFEMGTEAAVIVASLNGHRHDTTIRALLPEGFDGSVLRR